MFIKLLAKNLEEYIQYCFHLLLMNCKDNRPLRSYFLLILLFGYLTKHTQKMLVLEFGWKTQRHYNFEKQRNFKLQLPSKIL